jgi:hypothetical protein
VLEFWNNLWGLGTGPPAYVAWRAGTATLFLLGSYSSMVCYKIPALSPNFKTFKEPGICSTSKESIPPDYVSWRAGTITLFLPPRLFKNSSTGVVQEFCRF